MAGATSLVELILKKWGDDIAGAAKELEEKVGFPESVANRIATGELPMDPKSVEARRIEQGYGDELYHGSTHDIREFNGRGNPQNDWGEGTYLSDSTSDVSDNYAGTHGSDFKSRWFEEKERLEADYDAGKRPDLDDGDGSFDDWKAREEAIGRFQGENQGVIYPVRVKQEGLFSAVSDIDRPDYVELAREELGLQDVAWSDLTDDAEESLWDMADELRAGDYSHPQYTVNKVTGEYGVSDVPHLDDHETWSSVRDDLLNEYAEDEAGNYVGAGRMVGEMLQDLGAKGVYDPTTVKRHDSMGAGRHTIMFPGSENQIRSVNAAFDPEYTGPNIMGGAALPIAAGLLAMGQSDDADAGISAPLKLAKRLADLDPKMDAHISERPTGLILDKLVVPEEARGQGLGGELMERLTTYADEEGQRVALTAAGDFGGTRSGQERFYRRHGFVPNKGRNKDFEFTENMVRTPSERGNADPRLLAGVTGMTAAGLAAPMIKDSGMISAPRSETLFDLTMGARDIERRLEGSLASLLFPSGLVDYLETVNRREEDPNAMTRGMALLDVLPF